ncbi:venom serine protease inhibitor-like [Calliopsis andreniformis]|uniref:venom serine protease inhibitor-like n=1 Tax=Calliopsis andreniformis TaxID=337506 RepID=UPI003FCCB27C
MLRYVIILSALATFVYGQTTNLQFSTISNGTVTANSLVTCAPNEIYVYYAPICEMSCGNQTSNCEIGSGCICINNYYRNSNNICVPFNQC